jgi:hypothetical protein
MLNCMALLRRERLKLTNQLVAAKRELRRQVTEIEHIEARLANIEVSENNLLTKPETPRGAT